VVNEAPVQLTPFDCRAQLLRLSGVHPASTRSVVSWGPPLMGQFLCLLGFCGGVGINCSAHVRSPLSSLLLPVIQASIKGKESEAREKGSLPCAYLRGLPCRLASAQPRWRCHPVGAPLCRGRRSGSLRRRVFFLAIPVRASRWTRSSRGPILSSRSC
jgi:hypothetical protein